MTFLYDAQYSFVLLRPKTRSNSQHKVQTSGWLGILFLRLQEGPRRSDFSGAPFATNVVPEKKLSKKDAQGAKKKNYLEKFQFWKK